MLTAIILIIVVSTTSVMSSSPVTCSSNETACDRHADNIIDDLASIETLEECRQLCYDSEECDFLTYYGDQSFPVRHLCTLLKTCEVTHACTDCVSETKECFYGCPEQVVGLIEDNIIDFYQDVQHSECRESCSSTPNCTYSNKPKSYMLFMLP